MNSDQYKAKLVKIKREIGLLQKNKKTKNKFVIAKNLKK